ncbi:MAG: histidine phosphatase family protein [Clostridia bacterium]|nr:histidine phosphatase family protein [Clostridia bacterium]
MRSYKIHLIRHGATDANKEGRYVGGKTDLPLSAESRRELKTMKEKYRYPWVDIVYSSPMQRCTETAKILFPEREIITVEGMREYDFGEFENKTAVELDGRPDYTAWTSGQMPSPPGGESSKDFTARVVLALNEIIRDMMARECYESALIMHGGAIMMLLAACALPQHSPVEWTSENGTGYTVLITPSLYQKSGIIEAVDLVPQED